MSWRIVVISSRAKLDLRLSHLVIRSEEIRQIHLNEISQIIIENTAVSLTACLVCELVKRKIKIVFCDEQRNPQSEVIPYYGSHDNSAKIRNQIAWNDLTKQMVWTRIVAEKITNQKLLLEKYSFTQASLLEEYLKEMEFNDRNNREGHAAKVYFNALFGLDFTRSCDNIINAALNYGYAILLSAFNREVIANGYLTQLGIFHNNMFNPFNLSSDLMEPFRQIVDEIVFEAELKVLGTSEKMMLVNILNKNIIIDNQKNYLNNAIRIYCKSVFNALNKNDVSEIRFYRNEF